VGEYSVPQPDITVVIPRLDYYASAHPQPLSVLLVVEVADFTLKFDRDAKTAMYARSGVSEVWMVDVGGRRILRSCSPRDGVYRESTMAGFGDSSVLGALPHVRIDVQALFPR
jgi:Uma2 family endonuclease